MNADNQVSDPPASILKIATAIQSALLNFAKKLSPPFLQPLIMSAGFWNTQILLAAVRLNIADHLKDGPLSTNEFARMLKKANLKMDKVIFMASMFSTVEAKAN